jgi:hypothetical protein
MKELHCKEMTPDFGDARFWRDSHAVVTVIAVYHKKKP